MADDYIEEHKLLGQDSERVKYLSLGQLDSNDVDGEFSDNHEETIAHLRECIKTERDQKVTTVESCPYAPSHFQPKFLHRYICLAHSSSDYEI